MIFSVMPVNCYAETSFTEMCRLQMRIFCHPQKCYPHQQLSNDRLLWMVSIQSCQQQCPHCTLFCHGPKKL